MRSVSIALVIALLAAVPVAAQEARLASDFEIAQMEKQLARSRGFEAQLAGRLNLGDVRKSRGEPQLARDEYRIALQLATAERRDARLDSALTRYAHATSYAALAEAKLGNAGSAFALLEESLRYGSDDAETWNLYASAMRIVGHGTKAVAAGRNAVAIAAVKDDRLDLAVYQHALATALIENRATDEAESLLEQIVTALRSDSFRELRDEVARSESFEVYSSARGDVAAYVSLLNRAQLRLAALYEARGAVDAARTTYARVLEGRSDDATALAALARLASRESDRARHYEAAFQANPFAPSLIREYRQYVRTANPPEPCAIDCPTGALVRSALMNLERREFRAARTSLDTLIARFPSNEVLRTLRREAEGASTVALPSPPSPTATELRALLDAFERLTPQQRAALDAATYSSSARFEAVPFAAGTVEGIPFRFATAAQFAGQYDLAAPLRLTYRILGVTKNGTRDVLLLEPLRLEQTP